MQNCDACGVPLVGHYVTCNCHAGLVVGEHCWRHAKEQAQENYPHEWALGTVDVHALVIDQLLDAQDRMTPGWPRCGTTNPSQ